MGVLTAVKGILIWGSTSLTDVPASLGLVSTLVVDNGGNEYISYEGTEFIEGESQVLEEDESGFLRAYHNVLTGVTSLLRGCHKVRILNFWWSTLSKHQCCTNKCCNNKVRLYALDRILYCSLSFLIFWPSRPPNCSTQLLNSYSRVQEFQLQPI